METSVLMGESNFSNEINIRALEKELLQHKSQHYTKSARQVHPKSNLKMKLVEINPLDFCLQPH